MVDGEIGMGIKLIALDLDKTLVHNDGTISDYSVKVLNRCRDKGIKIAIVTAKSEYSAKKYVDIMDWDIVITSGGAVARAGEIMIHKALIPKFVLNQMIQDALKQPTVECIRVMGEVHELSNKTGLPEGVKDYGHYDYNDLKMPLSEDAWKIQFETSDILFLEDMVKRYPDCELISYHNEDLHKISNVRANKLEAVRSVCMTYDINMEEVIAFGDDTSDYNLMKEAGVGVAVLNAIERVKNVADFVCSSNEEDGVAAFIEKYIGR